MSRAPRDAEPPVQRSCRPLGGQHSSCCPPPPLQPSPAKTHGPQHPRALPLVLTGQVRRERERWWGDPALPFLQWGLKLGAEPPQWPAEYQPHPLLPPLTLLISAHNLCSQWIWGGEGKAGRGGFLAPLLPMMLWGTVSRDLEAFLIGPYSPTPPASSLRGKGFLGHGHPAFEDKAQMSSWVKDTFRGAAVS